MAFFSPLRPIPSGVSDYSEELLPALAVGADITVFVDGYQPANLFIRRRFPVYDYRRFASLHREQPFDVCLYHMGNHPCHAYIYELLQEYPGVVVLHDSVLHHFLGYLVAEKGDVTGYLAEFTEEEGLSLLRRRQARLWSDLDHFIFPGIWRTVACSRGLIVHSQAARRAVWRTLPSARVQVIPHHWGPQQSPYADLPAEEIKRRLGFPPDTFLVVSPGIVTPARRIPVILRLLAILMHEYPQTRAVIVGPDHPSVGVRDMIRRMRLDGVVEVTGFVDVPTFQTYILAADVVINLRYPLAGETSGGLVRAMGMGKPVLVSNAGQYAEFPDDCCLKVDLGEAEEEMALDYLGVLIREPALRRRIGEQARRYVQTVHALERSARAYLDFCAAVQAAEPPVARAKGGDEVDIGEIVEQIRREAIQKRSAGDREIPDLTRFAPPPAKDVGPPAE